MSHLVPQLKIDSFNTDLFHCMTCHYHLSFSLIWSTIECKLSKDWRRLRKKLRVQLSAPTALGQFPYECRSGIQLPTRQKHENLRKIKFHFLKIILLLYLFIKNISCMANRLVAFELHDFDFWREYPCLSFVWQ